MDESIDDCIQHGSNGKACTRPTDRFIIAYWMYSLEVNGQVYPRKLLNGSSAADLAHELGHVYYYQTTGDSDHNHTHQEWFDDYTIGSITNQVYGHYYRDDLE